MNQTDYDNTKYISTETVNNPNEKKIKKNFNKNSDKNICLKVILVILSILLIVSIGLNIYLIMKIKKDLKYEDGYFLPNDNKSVCHSCQLSNCKSCTGTKESQKCTSCMNDYMPIYGNDGFITNCTNIYNTSTDKESYTDERSDLDSETDLDTGKKSDSNTDLDTGNKSGEETDINTIKKSDSETDLDTGKNLDSETNLDTGNKSD